jgi:hypothetical protein
MSMQTLERKKFVLYYDPDFVGGERTQIVGQEFFTDESGFRPMEIDRISTLPPMHATDAGPLKIWRVK